MSKPPNIVLILSDQHNPHILGCAGNTIVRTPHLDALAERGTRFRNAYCASPLCVPSRMSLMTSRKCSDIGVWSNHCVLDSSIPTFAHALQGLGYDTVLCGRMHFNGPDQLHGFGQRIMGDVFHGVAPTGSPYGIFENVIPSNGQKANCVTYAGPGQTVYGYYDGEVTNRAIQFLTSRKASDRPFALVVGYMLPHNPFICDAERFYRYLDKVDLPEINPTWQKRLHPAMELFRSNRQYESITPEQTRVARAAYFGLIETMDAEIGRLLATLHEQKLEDQTITLYTSDHGEGAGEHGLWTKSHFYEASVKVPMIWSGPGIAHRAVRDQVVSLLDVGSTLTALGGNTALLGHGRNMVPLLGKNPSADWDNRVTSEYGGSTLGDPAAVMTRMEEIKVIAYAGHEQPEIYDLNADPGETRDLGTDPATLARLQPFLEQLPKSSGLPSQIARAAAEQESTCARAFATDKACLDWPVPVGTNQFDVSWERRDQSFAVG